jgi:hypothetical protein
VLLRRIVFVPLALVAVVALAGAGQEIDPVTAAAESLPRDPVYVDPSAERALTDDEADRLRDEIRASGTPVFVAVLPSSAGDPDDVVRRLSDETGLSGTYAAVVGDGFRAGSTDLANADELATASFQAASGEGAAAVLLDFVDRTAAEAAGGASPAPGDGVPATPDDDGRGDGGGDGGSSLVPLALIGAGGVGVALWGRRRRRRAEAEQRARVTADAQLIRAELQVLADDVLRLEPEVELHPEARDDYEAAVERHRVASGALDYADEPIDLVRVDRVVAEARYAMARAKALVAGREPPPPPGDLRRPGAHQEPPLDVDERGVPVYAGGMPFYGGGWFGGGGGLFGGLLLGSMLGGWGWGWGGPIVIDHGDGGWDDGGNGGGGDLGGGDWGGGGLGGGDWGGDIGGGDW